MFGLISKLHNILNELKNFDAGYSTNVEDKMIIKHHDKVYLVELTEMGEGEVSDYL
jgi:hypothetical protein